MNEKLLNHEMYFNMLDVKFKQLMDYKQCFKIEILESDYNDYYTDMFEDNLKLMMYLNNNYSGQYYIDEKIAAKIMNHIESADLLMRDTRRYLSLQVDVTNFFERIENYKKEGK